jgi:electron transfer flavoprotein beta subunit
MLILGRDQLMLVVVCVKQVPDTTQVKIDPVTNTLIREGIPFIMNPFDTHALEEALILKDRFGVRVAAISMGPPNTEMTLRKALSLGIDEAVLLSDRAFGGADTLATSMVLSEAIKKLALMDELILVLCGKQTIDGDTAQVGPGIAIRLNLVPLTLVDRIEDLDIKNKRIIASRKLEGRHEKVQARLPALLTLVREINKPRYPRVPLRLEAQDMPVELWDNNVMNLDVNQIGLKGSPTSVRRIFSPEREQGEILGDGVNDPSGASAILVEKLLQKELLTF